MTLEETEVVNVLHNGKDIVPCGRMNRNAVISRETKETCISIALTIDGQGEAEIDCQDFFLQHMLNTLCRYAGFNLTIQASGDDIHHLIEDVGIVMGTALSQAKGDSPVERMASCTLPMDDALVTVSLDLVDRPYADLDCPDSLYHHFLRSFAMSSGMTLHVLVLRGFDDHHIIEATFKALGKCLQQALRPRSRELSTKDQAVTRSG